MRFVVYGQPEGKQRARTVRGKNGEVHSYTPTKTVKYEGMIKRAYLESPDRFKYPIQGGVIVRIEAYFDVPKSYTRKQREAIAKGRLFPKAKPDVDNIAKIVCDALNGIAYKDDSRIINLSVSKGFDILPRVEVEIMDAEGESV